MNSGHRLSLTYRIRLARRSLTMTTNQTTDKKGTGKYAKVNGLNLYYETHGAGRPLILLHGGLMSSETFGPVLPQLSERHQVIAPDLQGHDRTADIDRPIDVRLMADDIDALIDHRRLLAGRWCGASHSREVPGQGPAAGRSLREYPPRRDLCGDASAARPGERGRRRVHERHADVPALPQGRTTSRGLPEAARQARCVDGEGLRLRRRGPRSSGAHAHRRRRR